MDNEAKAMELAGNKSRLLRRLKAAKAVLTPANRRRMVRPFFEFEGKRLVSGDRKWALQWQVRDYPGAPVSPRNQQTSEGVVRLVELTDLSKWAGT